MTSIARLLVVLPLLALGACSTSSYCEDQPDYELATSVPALKGDDKLQLPQSEAALKIPPRPENVVAYGEPYKDEEGDDEVRCLDKPPEMPKLPEAPKPAEGAAPAASPAAPEATPANPAPGTPPPG
jgi:hypothetical protein